MTGLNNPKIYASINPIPLTFEEFSNKLNILQSDYVNGKNCECTIEKDVSKMTHEESKSEIKKNDLYGYLNRIDKEIKFSNDTIRNIQQIRTKFIEHMDSYTELLTKIKNDDSKSDKISGGNNEGSTSSESNESINTDNNAAETDLTNNKPNETIPKNIKLSIKIFPSKKIEIPKDFDTIQDYKNFIELVYTALINQYNNLLQVLSQLNDPHLNKIINKSFPPEINVNSNIKEDIDYASEELSPLYFRYISEFIHLLASENDGLFQYYYYLFKWIYAYWKITTYTKIHELLMTFKKKLEEKKSLLKQKKDDKLEKIKEIESAKNVLNHSTNNIDEIFNTKYPNYIKEIKELENYKTKYETLIDDIELFISDHYSDYDDPEHKVFKDKEMYKEKIDQYQYHELYKKLKLMEGNMKETTSRVSLTNSKMRETISKAMEDEATHQEYMRNKQIGGKRRTRKWYKFQKRAIRNTMKYLKYREKKR